MLRNLQILLQRMILVDITENDDVRILHSARDS